MKPRTWLVFLIVALLLAHAQPIHAVGLRNLTVLELYPLWLDQSAQVLDPPCRAVGVFPNLAEQIQRSVVVGDTRALTHLGRVRWLEGHCTEAVDAWEQAWTGRDQAAAFELVRVGEFAVLPIDMRRTIADEMYQRGNAVAKKQGDQAAVAWFRRSFDLMPQHTSASALANLYRKSENTAAIFQLWRGMADGLPSVEADHWWAVAELYGLENKWESAARAYTQGAGLTSDSYSFWMRAGSAWERVRQSDAAIAAYQRAYQTQPNAAWAACLSLGKVYRVRGEYSEALRWYQEARAKDPKNIEAYFRLGETYYLMGDRPQARRYLGEALQIKPDHSNSMYWVAKILRDEGNRELADNWMLDALTRVSDRDTQILWWMELGDWRLAWRDCVGARAAYSSARDAGAKEQTVQQKIKAIPVTCSQ